MPKTVRRQDDRKRCRALTKAGERCRNLAVPQCDPFCHLHCDPEPSTSELEKAWRVIKVGGGIGSGIAAIVKIIEWVSYNWPLSYVDRRTIELQQQADMYIHLVQDEQLSDPEIEVLAEDFLRNAEAWFAKLPRNVRTKAISAIKMETKHRTLTIEK